MGKISVQWNTYASDHERLIKRLLSSAKRFDCMVAFARWSGFHLLDGMLLKRLKRGMHARFIVGLDFYHTDPQVLRRLLSLSRSHDVEVFVGTTEGLCTFHPKLYRFDDGARIALVVGSANLTRGGLSHNYEVSTQVNLKHDGETLRYIGQLIDGKEVVELTGPMLDEYARSHCAYHALRSLAEKRVRKALATLQPGVEALRAILDEMKSGGTESEFLTQVEIRSRARGKARGILRTIEMSNQLSRQDFLRAYDALTSGVWQSGGLHRSKTKIARRPSVFAQIVKMASNSSAKSVAEIFGDLRQLAERGEGVGPNILTEILQTFDNTRFPIMNQNSVAGMKLAGFLDFPERPSRASVDGAMYAGFSKLADSIRHTLNLRNMSELDALFNYAYWRDDTREADD